MITQEQLDMLQSRYFSRGTFNIGRLNFNCIGESQWVVSVNGQQLDVYSFNLMTEEEIRDEIDMLQEKAKLEIFMKLRNGRVGVTKL